MAAAAAGGALALALLLALAGASSDGDALAALRRSLREPGGALQSWDANLVDPCTWFHVTCDADSHITRLSCYGSSWVPLSQTGQFPNGRIQLSSRRTNPGSRGACRGRAGGTAQRPAAAAAAAADTHKESALQCNPADGSTAAQVKLCLIGGFKVQAQEPIVSAPGQPCVFSARIAEGRADFARASKEFV